MPGGRVPLARRQARPQLAATTEHARDSAHRTRLPAGRDGTSLLRQVSAHDYQLAPLTCRQARPQLAATTEHARDSAHSTRLPAGRDGTSLLRQVSAHDYQLAPLTCRQARPQLAATTEHARDSAHSTRLPAGRDWTSLFVSTAKNQKSRRSLGNLSPATAAFSNLNPVSLNCRGILRYGCHPGTHGVHSAFSPLWPG